MKSGGAAAECQQRETAVRRIHLPTGIVHGCGDPWSNKERAMEILKT